MFLSGFPHNYLPITYQVSESWKCPNGRSLQFQVHNRAPVTGPTGCGHAAWSDIFRIWIVGYDN